MSSRRESAYSRGGHSRNQTLNHDNTDALHYSLSYKEKWMAQQRSVHALLFSSMPILSDSTHTWNERTNTNSILKYVLQAFLWLYWDDCSCVKSDLMHLQFLILHLNESLEDHVDFCTQWVKKHSLWTHTVTPQILLLTEAERGFFTLEKKSANGGSQLRTTDWDLRVLLAPSLSPT